MAHPRVLAADRHESLERIMEVITEHGDASKVERIFREPGQVEAKSSYIFAAMFEAFSEIVVEQEARISELESQLLATSK
jgi:uncharacterized protein YceH (UPF0502 family)